MQGPAPCMAFFFCPATPVRVGVAMTTFAETMLAKYETLLQTSAGLDTVSVDGQSVRYADVEAKYRYWKREVAREKHERPQGAFRGIPAAHAFPAFPVASHPIGRTSDLPRRPRSRASPDDAMNFTFTGLPPVRAPQ